MPASRPCRRRISWQPAMTHGWEWQTRTGDIHSPKIPNDEPLKLECLHFLSLVRGEGDREKVARDGLGVVRALPVGGSVIDIRLGDGDD